ncbi:MAG: PD-(D/E)XK nuclease family protein [Staphylococcus sp.]|nr:PD-(D/E)XK nuclease family protein [Staphylococcus sp.]
METFKLSYSKLSDFLSCPKKFQLKHILGKDEEFKETIYTAFGSAIHSAIEETLNKNFDFDAAFCVFKRELEKHILGISIKERQLISTYVWHNKGEIILKYFFKKYFNKLNGNVIETEKYFSFPIKINEVEISFNGFIDLIYKVDEKIKIIDWKTGKKQLDSDDLQLRIYAFILNKLFGYDISEITYAFIKEETENTKIINEEILKETEQEINKIINEILTTRDFKRCFSNNCRYCNVKKYCMEEY